MSAQSAPLSFATRRHFLKGSAAVASALAAPLVVPQAVHASSDDTIRVGLIGCGGRGSGAAVQALNADKNVQMVAVGDAFKDRAEAAANNLRKQFPDEKKVRITPDRIFVGMDAYQKVIHADVDVVILTAPPHFRPAHLKAAIEAGKHVFCEKPMAVDAPGVRSILATVEEAKKKKLNIVAGFCWRYDYAHRALFQLIHAGVLGPITSHYSTYNTGGLWNHGRKPEWSDMEWQCRNWLYFTWLSGDHLVEQAVHSVDKVAWARKDEMPIKAIAHGGRQVRIDPAYGNIFDHFAIVYDYADGTRAFHYCRQQDGCAGGVWDYITGTKGVANLHSGSLYQIKAENLNWSYNGPKNDMYQTEHDELFAAIRSGKPINDGPRMATSTMMAIMGRMAAYTGKIITWEQALNSKEDLTPPTYEWGPLPVAPVAMPGKTQFV